MPRIRTKVLFFCLAVLLSGCASGGASGPTTVTLKSVADKDGYVIKEVSFYAATPYLSVGDTSSGNIYVGALVFDLSGIPAGATIDSAVLRFYVYDIYNDPFGTLGYLKLDHFQFTILGALMLGIETPIVTVGTLLTSYALGWVEPDVTARVRDDLENSRSDSRYKFYFQMETSGGTADYIRIYSGDSEVCAPELVVTYTK